MSLHKLDCYWGFMLESPDGRGEDGSAISSPKLYRLLLQSGVLPAGIQITIVLIRIIVSSTCSLLDLRKTFMHLCL